MTRRSKANAGSVQEQTAAPKIETKTETKPTEEERRRELVRKLAMFASDWRRCPRAQCRRARACRLPDLKCFSARPPKPMTPEQETAMLAQVKRMLERRLAEFQLR
jgi:DNA segregation ATPase FtsK/SpoIIIE-like protein